MDAWRIEDDIAADVVSAGAGGLTLGQGTDRTGAGALRLKRDLTLAASGTYEVLADLDGVSGAGGVRITVGGEDVFGLLQSEDAQALQVTLGGSPDQELELAFEGVFQATIAQLDVRPVTETQGGGWGEAVILPGTARTVSFPNVTEGHAYDVRLRARAKDGLRPSPNYAYVLAHTIVGKSSPPPDPTGLDLEELGDGTRLFTWDEIPDVLDLAGFELRARTGTATSWSEADWTSATPLHGRIITAESFETGQLAAGEWSFGLRSVDTSGNRSTGILVLQQKLSDPPLGAILQQYNEGLNGWPGTLTDCFVSGSGILFAVAEDTIADLPGTIAELPATLAELGGAVSPFIYETAWFDIGQGRDIDFEIKTALVTNVSAAPEMMVRTFAEGMTTGTWEDYAPVKSKCFVKLRITFTGANGWCTSMIHSFAAQELIDRWLNLDTSAASDLSAGYERIGPGHIKVEHRKNVGSLIGATAISRTAARTLQLVSSDTTLTGRTKPAAEFKVFQVNGTTPADAVLDIRMDGIRQDEA